MLLHYGSWQKGIDMKLQESTTEAVAATREQRAKAAGRRYRRQQSAFDILIIFLIVQVISVIYGLINPSTFAYNSFANIQNALGAIPVVTGIPALGVGILMIAGEFDLSVGANFIFSSILMAQLNTNGLSVWLAALIGLAVGTGIGLLNGVITLRLGIPSFITTLGTMLIWQAGTLFVHGASSQPFSPSPGFAALTAGNLGVFPADFLWFVVLAIAFWALLQRNRIGNHIFAAGGNKQAATATGVRVDRTKLIAFSLFMTGASLVFAGAAMDGASLFDLMDAEGVTCAQGVPTIWMGLIGAMRERGRKPRALARVTVGGAAVPPSMVDAFEKEFGVTVHHGWGMTEMTPVGTVNTLKPKFEAAARAVPLAPEPCPARLLRDFEWLELDMAVPRTAYSAFTRFLGKSCGDVPPSWRDGAQLRSR